MNQAVIDHLTSINLTFFLKYGPKFRDHAEEMGDYWDGPLDDGTYFLGHKILKPYTKRNLSEVMSKLTDFEFHPVYNRDFFQGIVDALGGTVSQSCNLSKRIQFWGRPELKEFLESKEHGFSISFGKHNKDDRHRTLGLTFLHLPTRNRWESYLAGAIAAGTVGKDEDNCPTCYVHKDCAPNFRKFGILFQERGQKVSLSPFYIMLFCGDLPEGIYSLWLSKIVDLSRLQVKRASIEAWMHWRLIFGKGRFKANRLPFLINGDEYYHRFGLTIDDLGKMMAEKRFDFIDKRIRQRCERWYNIRKKFNAPLYRA